ncbi:MAG: Flp pilus assembly complex ATPase component TadA [Tepidisphaera sp.]
MGKYNIDDILNDLGMGDEGDPRKKKHRIDKAESSFSPLPSVPANQPADPSRTVDPAVPVPPRESAESTVGRSLSDIYQPEDESGGAPVEPRDLGQLLLTRNAVTEEKLQVAQQIVKQSPGKKLQDVLIEQGVDEVPIAQAIADLAGVPFERVDLDKGLDGGFDGTLLQRLTPEFCKQHLVLPLRMEGQRAVVGVTRPDDVFILDELKSILAVPGVKLVLVTAFDVRGALEVVGGADSHEDDVSQILAEVEEGDVQVDKSKQEETDLSADAGAASSPVIKYVNRIIQMAVKEGASDIHIEPAEKKLKVRFRVDGELYEMLNPPASMASAITSRLKIMANLDISERRLPQDGRIRCVVGGRKLDLRMSTLPCAVGEKTVMRILDTKSINVELEQLGFDENTLSIWKNQINAPHGIVLVTGPTGSGKTTTLYASLRTLDKNSMNISTVEDPVEYYLEGINQTQTHEKIGMTFSAALRALLRQDPDVILLGEIRDKETAHIGVQAALTGHLVLSTLHTNDAPSSVTRLVNIGLEPFLVGAALNAVLAQRLIRRLCSSCKTQEAPGEEMAEFLELQGLPTDQMWVAKSCDRCRKTGYSGRVGLYELLAVDDQLRDVIARNPNVSEFRRLCIERGMVSLRADGIKKVSKGQTTIQEVLRVTDSSH